MSCGTRLDSHDRYGLADSLEREGEYRLARAVRHGECLDHYELRRAEDALERQGLRPRWDFEERTCRCSGEDES